MKTQKSRTFKKFACFVCAIALLCSAFLTVISANISEETQEVEYNLTEDCTYCHDSKPLYLSADQNQSNQYTHGSVIEQSYEIISSYSFDSYVISVNVCDGITLESPSTINLNENDSKTFTIRFRVIDENFFTGVVSVNLSSYMTQDSQAIFEASSNIYCLKSENYNYVSLISKDALSVYSKELSDNIESVNSVGESSEIIYAGNPNARSASGITVSGTILWTDSADNTHPARNLTVEIWCEAESSPRAIVTTNSNGYYSCNYTALAGENSTYIVIKTSGLNITVTNNVDVVYSYPTEPTYNLYDGAVIDKSHTFSNETEMGKAVSVHQAMEMANRYIYELEDEYMENLTVCFNTSPTGQGNRSINVDIQDAFDWDVLQHEYGHFVADMFFIDDSPGWDHEGFENLIDELGDKESGIELAWSEGFATYFAIKLQEEMGAASLNIPNVGDRYYNDTDDITLILDLETSYYYRYDPWEPNEDLKEIECLDLLLGEGNEAVVAGILYDLTDSTDSADYDHVYYDDYTIWSYIIDGQCTTLSDFIQEFYIENSIASAIDLGVTLEYFRVAAQLNDPLMVNTDTPYFSWIGNGGGETAASTNNSFSLVFYTTSYQYIAELSIPITTTNAYIQLTKDQWDLIKILAGSNTFYCCIRASQANSPGTGPYLSSAKTITLS